MAEAIKSIEEIQAATEPNAPPIQDTPIRDPNYGDPPLRPESDPNYGDPPLRDNPQGDPIPFDIDGYFNEWNSTQPVEKMAANHDNFAKTMWKFVEKRGFLNTGLNTYNIVAELNRATAGLFAH